MRSGLILVLLFGTLAFGQSEKLTSHAGPSGSGGNSTNDSKAATSTAPDAAVITIGGLCEDSANKKPASSDCKTVITRQQFERLIEYVQPNLTEQFRKNFAASYAQALISAQQARKMGLDSGPRFEALVNMQREYALQYLLSEALQQKAKEVPESDIEQYYKEHKESFEEIEFERLYVPVARQGANAEGSSTEIQKRQQESVSAMKGAADELHARAVKGEDFTTLQAEAYKAAEYASTEERPKVQTGKVRRNGLPPAELSVMDLKPGAISPVFDESNGHYVYKILARRTLLVEEVKPEISEKLRAERLEKYQRELRESATATLNDTYFPPLSASPAPDNP